MKKYQITIVRPGGNDTALVKGIIQKNQRKKINDQIMQRFPNVEQVGFYEYYPTEKNARLEMAGGEFCGNAIRSLAFLLLNGKKGELKMKVSGTKKILYTGSKRKNTSYAQMPIPSDARSIKRLSNVLFLINLEGITHLIYLQNKKQAPEKLKEQAKELLKRNDLLYSKKAAGVMFVSNISQNKMKVDPVVWVRDIKTLFYETSCASGSTAIALWKAKERKQNSSIYKILQPSGKYLTVSVEKNLVSFRNAVISGSIEVLLSKEVKL